MKQLLFIAACFLLLQCQKEMSVPAGKGLAGNTRDSLTGRWRYIYDYRLVATVANPDVIIDSVYSGNYEPFSYFELSNDSTFKWYRTEMQGLPTWGYGVSGKWRFNDTTRQLLQTEYKETQDDFGAHTYTLNPPRKGVSYRIKYLGKDSMVLYFRVTNGSLYWYWHDVFKK